MVFGSMSGWVGTTWPGCVRGMGTAGGLCFPKPLVRPQFAALRPGPYGVVFSLLWRYFVEIPPISKFSLFGVALTDKLLVYALALQVPPHPLPPPRLFPIAHTPSRGSPPPAGEWSTGEASETTSTHERWLQKECRESSNRPAGAPSSFPPHVVPARHSPTVVRPTNPRPMSPSPIPRAAAAAGAAEHGDGGAERAAGRHPRLLPPPPPRHPPLPRVARARRPPPRAPPTTPPPPAAAGGSVGPGGIDAGVGASRRGKMIFYSSVCGFLFPFLLLRSSV